MLYWSTIWPMMDLPKNLALAKVSSTLPELEEELEPHAARTGAAAAAPTAAPPSCRNLRRLRGVGVLRGTIAAPLHKEHEAARSPASAIICRIRCRYMRQYARSRGRV